MIALFVFLCCLGIGIWFIYFKLFVYLFIRRQSFGSKFCFRLALEQLTLLTLKAMTMVVIPGCLCEGMYEDFLCVVSLFIHCSLFMFRVAYAFVIASQSKKKYCLFTPQQIRNNNIAHFGIRAV